jgi:hypothetical protein
MACFREVAASSILNTQTGIALKPLYHYTPKPLYCMPDSAPTRPLTIWTRRIITMRARTSVMRVW